MENSDMIYMIIIGVSEGQSSRELLTETLPTDFPLQIITITTCLLSLNFPNKEPVGFRFEQKSLRLMKC